MVPEAEPLLNRSARPNKLSAVPGPPNPWVVLKLGMLICKSVEDTTVNVTAAAPHTPDPPPSLTQTDPATALAGQRSRQRVPIVSKYVAKRGRWILHMSATSN